MFHCQECEFIEPAPVDTRTAKCGCNFFWLSLESSSLTNHVPLRTQKIKEMAESYFKEPKPLFSDPQVAVSPLWADLKKKVDPAAERPFKLISAPESLHSMVIAIRRDCDEEIKDNLIAWRRILLSTSVIFKVIENSDEMYWEHLSLREKPGLEYDLVRHSALQRICDIQQRALHVPSYHRTSNRALAKMLFKDYQRLQVSERSEKITETFIFHCLEAVGSVNT